MKQLIDLMYPSHSPQRRELREEWNETDSIPWEDYLAQAALEKADELIAKFLGHSEDPSSGVWNIDCPHEGYGWHTEVIKYHWSWDWLMPVLNKICSSEAYIEYKNNLGLFADGIEINTKFISVTYIQVVEFILWYNENKTNEK